MKELGKMKHLLTLIIVAWFFFHPVTTVHGFGWACKPSRDETLPDVGIYGELIKDRLAFYADFTGEKHIYLTFDNGYDQGHTASILDILKKHDVPATFFVTGHYVKSEPELIKRMVDEGHIIGNHSYTHPDFTKLSKAEMAKELKMVEKAVKELTDQKEMVYVRPPRGMFNENTLRWAEELGYIHIFWSVAFKDWEVDRQRGWEYAYNQMMQQVHPGAIVLLHTVSEDNAKALDQIITDLKERGYSFKSLDDLALKHLFDDALFF